MQKKHSELLKLIQVLALRDQEVQLTWSGNHYNKIRQGGRTDSRELIGICMVWLGQCWCFQFSAAACG